MSFFNGLKRVFGVAEDYEDYETPEEELETPESFERPVLGRRETAAESETKVVNINATQDFKVVMVRPEAKNPTDIADHLKCQRAVVLNLERTGDVEARRVLDFLSGVAYAQDGTVQRIAEKAYIITPFNIDLENNDLIYETE